MSTDTEEYKTVFESMSDEELDSFYRLFYECDCITESEDRFKIVKETLDYYAETNPDLSGLACEVDMLKEISIRWDKKFKTA